ncbi:PP2C family protein-serine/threonine phosphatase [Herbidospora mongoliensis]|uniref:PP2C family protein-serine/threonine phosphatase n=1 Tax=Herbidospora mongoliensis TaxID=688067 RepID=UPI0009FC4098|nr:SpoIIE family protein phosphatase [Herbidospora mongoliensis]
MMTSTGHDSDAPEPHDDAVPGDGAVGRAAFSALLEDSPEDLYENAPCGYLSTLLDGQIAKVNATLLGWLGYRREELVGRRSFSDLLTMGGRLYHETHFAPLLKMQGQIGGVALELRAADGRRLPVLVTSVIKTSGDGQPQLVRTTIFDATDRRAYEQELLRARREAEQERRRLQELVTTLQASLLPPSLPQVPGLRTATLYHIASRDEVSGDFYDLFQISRDRWAFFLGDVCGKGAGAASVTSLIRYTLRAAAAYDGDPLSMLTTLNTALFREYRSEDPRYCTVIVGVLTPDGDGFTVALASGGHPPALLLGADGEVAFRQTRGGMLVGMLADAVFTTTSVRLGPGDTLLLYTDGLTEAHAPASGTGDGRYGEEALHAFATGLGPTTAEGAITALAEVLRGFGDGLTDDAAVLALSVPAAEISPSGKGRL